MLRHFLNWSCKTAGKPITFVMALLLLCLWIVLGFIYGFTDKWLLILDSVATVNASLMVFIIQHTQIRESQALHIKIDGIISAIKEAEKKLIAIEEAEEEELEEMRKSIVKKHRLPRSANDFY